MFLSASLWLGLLCIFPQLGTAAPLLGETPKATAVFKQAANPLVTAAASLEKRMIPADEKRTETIGYRRVHPNQAAIYNKGRSLVYDMDFRNSRGGGEQLGIGVYTTPNDNWEGNPGDWLCIIRAEPSKINNIDKIWLPATNECRDKLFFWQKKEKQLWWAKEKTIAKHIDRNDLDPNTTLRLARIQWNPPIEPAPYQILIPPKAIPELDATVDCFPQEDPVWKDVAKPEVNLDAWHNVHNREDKNKDGT